MAVRGSNGTKIGAGVSCWTVKSSISVWFSLDRILSPNTRTELRSSGSVLLSASLHLNVTLGFFGVVLLLFCCAPPHFHLK